MSLASVAIIVCSLGAAPAFAQEAEPDDTDEAPARELFRTGSLHFDAGDYADAADDFEASYELSGRPEEYHVLAWNDAGYQNFRWGIQERELLDAGTFREFLMDIHEEVDERVRDGELSAMPEDLVKLHSAAGLG